MLSSSLSANERLSKLTDPTVTQWESTSKTLAWSMVRWYSKIRPPQASSCS